MAGHDYVAVLDFGSQTSALIVRRLREIGVFAKLFSPQMKACDFGEHNPVAIILSGGPQSLCDLNAPRLDASIYDLKLPMLGICYGMQLLMERLGATLSKAASGEFGQREIEVAEQSLLFNGIKSPTMVWMSHSDQVGRSSLVRAIAHSRSCPTAAFESPEHLMYGVQFHPEVTHSEHGQQILRNFTFLIAKAKAQFDLRHFLPEKIAEITKVVGDSKVIMALSGGVDSSVAAALIARAVGKQLQCVFVDHGLNRHEESKELVEWCQMLGLNLHVVDAKELFLGALLNVSDPEQKRRIIGHTFIEVFEKEAHRIEGVKFLGQGTLYSDVIESSARNLGLTDKIKSHHNVAGLPERMKFKLLEPLRELFKDEVRILGELLGLPQKLLKRQPFPGPGLAVRIPGPLSAQRIALLREADRIVRDEIDTALENGSLQEKLWQWFAILLPVTSIGVKGDARIVGETVVLRCVNSIDAMTADWARLPHDILAKISSRLCNELREVSRVLYDITQKPPSTIEWE